MSKKIIVICDDTWSDISDSTGQTDTFIWTITDKGFNELLEGFKPKHLDEEDILNVETIHEHIDNASHTLGALDKFMIEGVK